MRHARVPPIILVTLILTVAIIVLFIAYGARLFERGEGYVTANQCRQSIRQNTGLGLAGHVFSSRIKCPTEHIPVSGDDDEIKQLVAQKLYQCWRDWGAGRDELFKPSDETFCVVCSTLEFQDKGQTISGLVDTLEQRVIPEGRLTYYEYLTGVSFKEGQKLDLNPLSTTTFDTIDTSQPLSIVFTYTKDAQVSRSEALTVGATVGAIAGFVGGAILLVVFPPAGAGVIAATVAITATAVIPPALAATGAFAGGSIGYMAGHDTSANWDARIAAVPFTRDQLQQRLGCTYFPASQTAQ